MEQSLPSGEQSPAVPNTPETTRRRGSGTTVAVYERPEKSTRYPNTARFIGAGVLFVILVIAAVLYFIWFL